MSKIELPLPGRTFERTQGCWNCTGLCDQATSLARWKATDRPDAEARIARAKLLVLTNPVDPLMIQRFRTTQPRDRCTCGSGKRYEQCHRTGDEAAALVFKGIEGIEMATAHLDRFEASIAVGDKILGQMGLCNERTSEKYQSFVSDKFLCDRWTAKQGASVARAGQTADKLPEELKDIHGDGND